MARSLAKVAAVSAPHEDYDQNTSFQRGHYTYQVERKADRVWHHEILSDDEGVIFDQAEEIQYAIGSNTLGRSYLLWREGILYVSPISWFANFGWELSPGYTPDHHFRFSRVAIEACIVCHSGQAVLDDHRENYFPQPVFRETSVGCERCHGPGKEHVEFRRQKSPSGRDPLVDLYSLETVEREAICNQCHFSGEGRVLRYGRAETDFRPGMKLGDIWTVFVNGDGTDGESTNVVSQATQMHRSRCFQASEGRFGCISCHDPHDSPSPDQRASYFNLRCLSCHSERGCSLDDAARAEEPANGSCIHCHMPPLKAKHMPHSSQTDHRILRNPSANRSNKSIPRLSLFEEKGVVLAEWERIRARGLYLSQIADKYMDRKEAEAAVAPLQHAARRNPDDEDVNVTLASMLEMLDRVQEADEVWRKILQQFPQHGDALAHLASSSYRSGLSRESDRFYSLADKVKPIQSLDLGRWAHTLIRLGRPGDAIPIAERAVKLDPSFQTNYILLSEAYGATGQLEKQKYYRRIADRLAKRLELPN